MNKKKKLASLNNATSGKILEIKAILTRVANYMYATFAKTHP